MSTTKTVSTIVLLLLDLLFPSLTDANETNPNEDFCWDWLLD